MKKIIKLFAIFFITLIIIPAMSCNHDPADHGESPYAGNVLAVTGEQAWEHDVDEGQVSKMYFESDASGSIMILDAANKLFGSGEVTEGKISLTLDVPEDLYDEAIFFGAKFSNFWDDITTVPDDIKGNSVLYMILNGTNLILKERIVGTGTSIELEYVVFIYVDNDCRVTGTLKQGKVIGTGYFNSGNLDLTLKQGWNMVCRTIRFDSTDPNVAIPMDMRELNDFRWTLWDKSPF